MDKAKSKILTDEEWATVQRCNLNRFRSDYPDAGWVDIVGFSIMSGSYDIRHLTARGMIPAKSIWNVDVAQRGTAYSVAVYAHLLNDEMRRAGFLVDGGLTKGKVLDAKAAYDKWLDDIFGPALDRARNGDALTARQRRLAEAWISFWHAVRAPDGAFNSDKRRGDLEAARKWAERSLKGTDDGDRLKDAPYGSKNRDELLSAMYAANVDNVSQYIDRNGNLRISKRNLADALGRKRQEHKTPVSLDAPHGDGDAAMADELKADIESVEASATDRETIELVRRLCVERAKVKARGRTVPVVRRNLEALANGTLLQADLAKRAGLDRGAVSLAFNKELSWLKEAMKKSAS